MSLSLVIAAALVTLATVTAQSPCSPSPCGLGAQCEVQSGSNAICSCPRGYTGDPFIRCDPFSSSSSSSGGCRSCQSSAVNPIRGGGGGNGGFGGSGSGSRFDEWECYKLSDCDFDKQCQGTPGRCIDPCTNNVDTGRPPCGSGADCVATRYKAICSCPKTHTGDPFVSCRPFTLADLCNPNPCGPNAFCEPGKDKRTGEDRPVCLCNEGFRGNGVTGCTPGDCISLRHEMCPNNRACYDSTCIDPCGPTFCGGSPCCNPTAQCRGVDHKAECSCPPGTAGEPRSGGECRRSSGGGVRSGAGGVSSSLCDPNPCGVNADCKVGSDNSGNPRPICTCPRGYRGNALVSCRRGECFNDSECPDHKACFDYKCKDPCKGPTTSCGVNANCRVVNHASVCSCPEGYRGDPISQCFTSRRG